MLSGQRLTMTLAAASLVLLSASPSSADPRPGAGGCGEWFCVEVGTGGSSGSSGSGSQAGGGEGGGSDDKPKCTYEKATGYEDVESQPVLDSDFWEGHDPSDGGALWYVTCGGTATLQYFGPGGPAAEAVSPAVLAQRALDKMLLRGPAIGITPKPGGTGVVGMPVYLWTETGAETYGPNTASASAGGVTVTATAKVSRIVWSMGDGKKVVCTTAGTPYSPKFGAQPSPDCGHRYTKASKYHVTATSTWVIDWTGGGQSGQLTEVRDSAVDIAVGEVQVVN